MVPEARTATDPPPPLGFASSPILVSTLAATATATTATHLSVHPVRKALQLIPSTYGKEKCWLQGQEHKRDCSEHNRGCVARSGFAPYLAGEEAYYDALCRKAVEQCPSSESVAECKKIEGGVNRVFLFTMNDEQTLIARLPFSLAGPPRLVIHSEVATIA
ncbi:hypothetical protein KCV03_g10377, partial [Aureobasidium melanogenum]